MCRVYFWHAWFYDVARFVVVRVHSIYVLKCALYMAQNCGSLCWFVEHIIGIWA
jgi:hypothetical protein